MTTIDPSTDSVWAEEIPPLDWRAVLPPGSVGGVTRIKAGDEYLLTESELRGLERAVTKTRRASGAARSLARQLCACLGFPVSEIPRARNGAPVWPQGIVGSLAHCEGLAAAVVARSDALAGLGIDVEPMESLSDEMLRLVATETERQVLAVLEGKALFSIKEAVFKALNPHDGISLDFQDVEVDVRSRAATTSSGRQVCWRVITEPCVLAVAWWA